MSSVLHTQPNETDSVSPVPNLDDPVTPFQSPIVVDQLGKLKAAKEDQL